MKQKKASKRKSQTILVTGGAGFIGSATTKALIDRGDRVVMIDNFNDFYDPSLKEDRLKVLLKGYKKGAKNPKGYVLYRGDIRDAKLLDKIFKKEKIDKVIHLAAMAGVRYSLANPGLYVDVNIVATTLLLDMAVKYKVKNFVYASSSSVYGANAKIPFSETDMVDTPISPYAATKKATELIAHVYSHIYKLPTTGLRFFTVYGPWGRPDMGVFKFVDWVVNDEEIELFNRGEMRRNFTYVDDIVSGVLVALDADLAYDVINIGGDRDEHLMDYIACVEKSAGKKAKKKLLPMQPGDVPSTVADISKLRKMGWAPSGIKNITKNKMDLLKLQQLEKVYESEGVRTEALMDATFTIKQGEFVAIMGPSGSGKSTLMQVLGLLDRSTGGTYELSGENVEQHTDDELALLRNEKIGFVFQSFNLLPRTSVAENVELPLLYREKTSKDNKERVLEALKAVSMEHRATYLSNQLSGGEKQRAAIARALVNDPDIIFADEPTGNLDSKSGLQVMRILQTAHAAGKTIILVTHETATAEHAERIIRMHDGRIVSDEQVQNRRNALDATDLIK
jgi:UDP-glucuronate 4-epimerase